MRSEANIVVIGAGIGGLTSAALLAKAGHRVTVFEAQTYPGGCAGTFYHQGYCFDAGATVAGGFQPGGPHALVAERLGIEWPVRQHEPAWTVHMPGYRVALTQDNTDVMRAFPESKPFWDLQQKVADMCWRMASQGIPWPPSDTAEWLKLARVGLANFPHDLRLLPLAVTDAARWLARFGVDSGSPFRRFIDAQLLISAQTTADHANALYSATALDLARQGVYHARGGMGGIAETLVAAVVANGGEIHYRQRVTRIAVERGRVSGVFVQQGRRGKMETFVPCDFLIGNVTPQSLDSLLGDFSTKSLHGGTERQSDGWGAFVLHLGIEASAIPFGYADHHQILTAMDGALGEGRSVFLSLSPLWDATRAPAGHRAVTISTHTRPHAWWDALAGDKAAYEARKADYTERVLSAVKTALPGFRDGVRLLLPGTPVTYQFYTQRPLGMVGGFPQTSLFRMRGPRMGIENLRLVGDSIFPGQSTAGVTLGALRVVADVSRRLRTGSAMAYLRGIVRPLPESAIHDP